MTVWTGAPGGGVRPFAVLCGLGGAAEGRAEEAGGLAAWCPTGELQPAMTAATAHATAALRAAFTARPPSLAHPGGSRRADHTSEAA
jgi:hypothetical protein